MLPACARFLWASSLAPERPCCSPSPRVALLCAQLTSTVHWLALQAPRRMPSGQDAASKLLCQAWPMYRVACALLLSKPRLCAAERREFMLIRSAACNAHDCVHMPIFMEAVLLRPDSLAKLDGGADMARCSWCTATWCCLRDASEIGTCTSDACSGGSPHLTLVGRCKRLLFNIHALTAAVYNSRYTCFENFPTLTDLTALCCEGSIQAVAGCYLYTAGMLHGHAASLQVVQLALAQPLEELLPAQLPACQTLVLGQCRPSVQSRCRSWPCAVCPA